MQLANRLTSSSSSDICLGGALHTSWVARWSKSSSEPRRLTTPTVNACEVHDYSEIMIEEAALTRFGRHDVAQVTLAVKLGSLVDHVAEQVFRVDHVGDQVGVVAHARFVSVVTYHPQRSVVFQCEADRAEHGRFGRVATAAHFARPRAPKLAHFEIGRHLLQPAFDPTLQLELDERAGAFQQVGGQLGLAR